MNKERRKELERAISLLNDAQENIDSAMVIVESIKDEEQESFDNLPESLQSAERGENMEESIDELDSVQSELDDMYSNVEDQIDAIRNVIDR